MRYIEKVREFNTAFDQGAADGLSMPAEKIQLLRIQLNAEEIGDLAKGMTARDLINCLHELCDVEYVVNGCLVVTGADIDLPPQHLPPSYQMHCTGPVALPDESICKVLLTSLLKDAGEVAASFAFGDPGEIAYAVNRMRGTVATCWNAFWVPEELRWLLFCEVHRANMSKLDANGNVILDAAHRVVKSDQFKPANIQAILDEYEDRF
jgi:predicted HAD superfamily Cof-like phosphohydrolase